MKCQSKSFIKSETILNLLGIQISAILDEPKKGLKWLHALHD